MALSNTNYFARATSGNINENWIVQLGYSTGSYSNGRGGWDSIMQSNGTSENQSAEAIDNSETSILVDYSRAFSGYVKVDNEIMKVDSIVTDSIPTSINATRGQRGTSAVTHNDNTTFYYENYTPISTADTIVDSVFYHGAILNKPVIKESIDLAKSKSKISNISITVANFDYSGNPFSEELIGGSNRYINQEVRIYSQLGSDDDLSDCLKIFSGRLTNVKINKDGKTITLQIVAKSPWDGVYIPQTKTSDTNKYFPVSYGNFTPNTDSSIDYRAYKTMFPIPVNEIRGDEVFFITGIHNISSNAYPHYYDRNLDRFLPVAVDDSYNFDTANESYKNGYAIRAYYKMPKKVLMKPVENSSSDSWTNGDNAFDSPLATETSNSTNLEFSQANVGTSTKSYKAKWLRVDHKIDSVKMIIAYSWTVTRASLVNGTQTCFFTNKTWGFDDIFSNTDNSSQQATNGTTSISVATDTSSTMVSSFDNTGGWQDDLQIEAKIVNSGVNPGTCTFTPYIHDIRAEVVSEIDFTDKDQGYQTLKGVDMLYCGGDGLEKSYAGGSGAITEIHEAHRDLLARFSGFDESDSDMSGWSALESSKDWQLRWWVLESKELKSILEELQYNGGFIFKVRADGTGQYIHIPDSITINHTLTDKDIADINVSHVPYADLVTKADISYEKHPADNGYLTSVTSANSTQRENWNIPSLENITQINLDAYTSPTIPSSPSSNVNDDWYSYYDNILSDLSKKIVTATIVNPSFYNIEVGDFVAFSSTEMIPSKAFGTSWSGLKFIITSTSRSIGKIKFTARQVS